MTEKIDGYGINWGLAPIPDGWRKKFAANKRFNGERYNLQGIAFSAETKDYMVAVATNGHRLIHVVERHTAIGKVYGIYCG